MSTSIKIQDQVYAIPSIDELTIKHLIDLRRVNMSSEADVLRWGLGKEIQLTDSKRTIREVGNTLTLIISLINDVYAWMQSDERIVIPNEVDVLGVVVKLNPGLLQQLPYWGTVRCKEVIRREAKSDGTIDYTDFIPEIIAHYLYVRVTKAPKYDEDAADEFIEVINELNMKTAVQLGNFFLLKQTQQFLNKRSYWLTNLTVMRKRLVLKFLQSMRTLIHSKH